MLTDYEGYSDAQLLRFSLRQDFGHGYTRSQHVFWQGVQITLEGAPEDESEQMHFVESFHPPGTDQLEHGTLTTNLATSASVLRARCIWKNWQSSD